jgi:hypothetical protein
MTRKSFRKSAYRYDRSTHAVFVDRGLLNEIREIAVNLCHHVMFVVGDHAYSDLDELSRYEGEKIEEIYIIGYDNEDDDVSLFTGCQLRVMLNGWKVEVEWDKNSGDEPESLQHIMELVGRKPKFEFRNLAILNSVVSYTFIYSIIGILALITGKLAVPTWLWVTMGASLIFMHFFTIREFIGSKPISLTSGWSINHFFRSNSNQLLLLLFGAAMGGFFAAVFRTIFSNGT